MDLSGRFNFWHMMLHTRAVTPPRVLLGIWPKFLNLGWRGVWLIAIAAVLAAAVILRPGVRIQPLQSPAVDHSATITPSRPAPVTRSW